MSQTLWVGDDRAPLEIPTSVLAQADERLEQQGHVYRLRGINRRKEIGGVLAECLCSWAFGIPLVDSEPGAEKSPDLERDIEVRSRVIGTCRGTDLFIQSPDRALSNNVGGRHHSQPDPPDRFYVLVWIMPGGKPHRIRGWVRGFEGQQDHWWQGHMPKPCYAVPGTELHPMRALEAQLEHRFHISGWMLDGECGLRPAA